MGITNHKAVKVQMLAPKHTKARVKLAKRMMNQDFGPVSSTPKRSILTLSLLPGPFLGREKVKKAAELEGAIRGVWAAWDPQFIPNLYGSMVRRLTAVVVAKGAATRY